MKILFLGTGKECNKAIDWTININHEIIGIIGDREAEECSKNYNIPFLSINDITEEYLNNSNPDVIISYLYNKRIREPLLSFAKYGCINFHPAPLPDYKGRGGCNIAIMDECEQWGATAHYVSENFDEGDIIKVYRFNFDYRLETAISLKRKTFDIMFELYKSVIVSVNDIGRLPAVKQEKTGTYLNYTQMLEMMAIDCEKDNIDKKIQAFWFPPYSGAYIEINGKKYTLVNDYILNHLKDNL